MLMQVDFYITLLERSKLHVGNGICEQCTLEQTRSPGEEGVKVDCTCKSYQCRAGIPMGPSPSSLLAFSHEGHHAGN